MKRERKRHLELSLSRGMGEKQVNLTSKNTLTVLFSEDLTEGEFSTTDDGRLKDKYCRIPKLILTTV